MFTNRLNWDLSLLINRTRVEWGNHVHIRFDQFGKSACLYSRWITWKKKSKILNFQLWQTKVPINNQNLLVSVIVAKSQDTGEEFLINLSTSGDFGLLTSPSNILLIPNDGTPRNYRGSSHPSLLLGSEKPLSRLGRSLSLSWLNPEPHSVLSPAATKQSLPQSTKTVQIVRFSINPQQAPVSEMILFGLGPLRDTHPFLLSSSTPTHLLCGDFLEKHHARISFSQKGEIILEFDSGHQNSQSGEWNNPSTSFICSKSDGTIGESWITDHLSLLDQLTILFMSKIFNW